MTALTSLVGSLLTTIGGLTVASWSWLYQTMRTGNPDLDRWEIRGVAAMELLLAFRTDVRPDIARAMMAIFRQETRGHPAPQVGDKNASGGPSIGAGQVYRRTAKDLGLWTPPPGLTEDQERAAYAALASDEARCTRMAVRVFRQKWLEAGGDLPTAIRRYNGSGSAAEAYRDQVITWAAAQGWRLA